MMPAIPDRIRVVEGGKASAFAGELALAGLKLPLSASLDEPGEILDADGRPVAIVDLDRQGSSADAARIAAAIVTAVNDRAGYPPVASITLSGAMSA